MATWGPIQLRLKGSRQVEFDGEASPAPGGGSMPVQVEHLSASSDTTIADNATTSLVPDTVDWGDDLIDLATTPGAIGVKAAGVYMVTAIVGQDTGFTDATSWYRVSVNLQNNDTGNSTQGVAYVGAAGSTPGVTVPVVADLDAAARITVAVTNKDGTAPLDFSFFLNVAKLS